MNLSSAVTEHHDMKRVAHRLLIARAEQVRALKGEAMLKELTQLIEALRRLDDGTWGTCEECCCAIGRNRLMAVPETRWCAGCARASEE